MKSAGANSRLLALDGLRGIAILFVFIGHQHTEAFKSILPPLIYNSLFITGGVGVGLLFILSGFLMAYLYPQPSSAANFIQKRYTRIFPLFLTVVLAMTVFTLIPGNLFLQTILFLLIAVTVNLIWTRKLTRWSDDAKRKLFFSFLILQGVTGIVYLLISQYIQLTSLQEIPFAIATGLVNATLTFFVDDSFPLLNGVFWSLGAEVIFYLIYPFICAPVIMYLAPKKRSIKIFFLFALLVFFYGTARILENVAAFSILRPDYFYYFVGGMSIGYLYRKYSKYFSGISKNYSWIVTAIGPIIICFVLAFIHSHNPNSYLKHILLTIPYSLILAIILVPKTLINKFFNSRIMVFLGTVSYSMYLSHYWITESIQTTFGKPETIGQTALVISGNLLFTILFSSFLYYLLERPYFLHKKPTLIQNVKPAYVPARYGLLICFCLLILYLATALLTVQVTLERNKLLLMLVPFFSVVSFLFLKQQRFQQTEAKDI